MTKMLSVFLIGIFLCGVLKAQTFNNYLPPTPAASQFEKYINYPVSHSTGAARVEVPLHSIKAKTVTIPISLSYHTAGVKPSDPDLPFGLGWTMNPGARVTRKILGYPDESISKSPYSNTVDDFSPTADLQKLQNLEFEGYLQPSSGYNATYDGEYDIFSYYTGTGISGKFVIKKQGTQYVAVPLIATRDKIIIDSSFGYFEIIDPNGTYYRFGDPLTSYSSGVLIESGNSSAVTGWTLTDIISADKTDTVSFKWANVSNDPTSNWYKQTGVSNYAIVTDNSGGTTPYNPDGCSCTPGYNEVTQYYFGHTETRYVMSVISGIRYKDQEVKFFYTAGSGVTTKIDSVNVTSNGKINKKVAFHRSFYSNSMMRLDSVSFIDANSQVANRYKFGYNTAIELPNDPTHTLKLDYWGYFNGKSNDRLIPDFLYEKNSFYTGPGMVSLSSANRTADPGYASAYILNSITYPTGGKTTYEYEGNLFGSGPLAEKAGGLRVKKINHWASDGKLAESRTYQYGNGQGYPMEANMYATTEWIASKSNYVIGYLYYRKRVISNETRETVFALDFPSVTYQSVTEFIGDTLNNNSGKIVYNYSTPDILTMHTFPGSSDRLGGIVKYFDEPQLLSQTYYKNDNGVYTPVQANIYDYGQFRTDTIKSDVVRRLVKFVNPEGTDVNLATLESDFTTYYPFSSIFQYKTAYLFGGGPVLQTRQTIDYSPNGNSIVSTQTYNYANSNYLYVNSIRTVGSGGDTSITHYRYPKDYTVGSSPSNPVAQGIKLLLDRNVVAPTIEEYTELRPANKIKSGRFTTYKTTLPLPDQSFTLAPGGIASSYTPVSITSSSHNKNASYYLTTSINDYDSYGNVRQLTNELNGLSASMLYNADGQFVFAQATNASVNEIFFESFEEAGTWDSPAVRDSAKAHTGRFSVRITNTGSGESTAHSTKWLTISSGVARKFRYSGWIYSNGPSAEIYFFMKRSGETGYYSYVDPVLTNVTNKWVYVEKDFEVPADVTQLNIRLDNNGTGTVWFDDIRLHPSEAMMTTYTYRPLTGVTSVSDVNSRPTYYEYDAFNRLTLIRDDQGNILKKVCYNYAGQAEDCGAYYTNVAKSGSFTKNNCAAGATGQTLTYTVPAGTYSSTISQADADAKAQSDVDTNGQAYANANGTCTWYSAAKSGNFTKNNCASGGTGQTLTYTVSAGTYSSTISQPDADAKAQNDVDNNGQGYANTNGTCTWYSTAKSDNFTKNNCASGGTGQTLTYTVSAGTYSSTISQADADSKAQTDVNNNGQGYANANGICTWYSAAVSGNYFKNCSSGYIANPYYVSIAAGTYSSTVSQAAANALATDAAQAQANANGTCTLLTNVFASNNTGNTYYLTFWNNSTGQNYSYTVYPWSTPVANIPVGTYTVTVGDTGAGTSAVIDVLGYSTYGTFHYVSGLSIGAGYHNIYMY